jgi:hypothetical protein
MPVLNLSDGDVLQLARQLPPAARKALALALLREDAEAPSLDSLRRRAHPYLAKTMADRGLDMTSMSPDAVDEAIQRICEEP